MYSVVHQGDQGVIGMKIECEFNYTDKLFRTTFVCHTYILA
jgi:hypothetical protein